MTTVAPTALTLGPLLHNWSAEARRDFYFRIADEAPVDTVCLGEVVCAKRLAFFEADLPVIADRLQSGGKDVVISSLALIMGARDIERVAAQVADAGFAVEANDVAAVSLLDGRPFDVGPLVNVYNEGTLLYLAGRGARRVCLPAELTADAIGALAEAATGSATGTEIEVQAFGRVPLAVSARCYHARAHGLAKDSCRYVCAEDPDGLTVETLDGRSFLAVNGIQTLSDGYLNLLADLGDLAARGVRRFRLHPHAVDMVAVARAFRAVLDGALTGAEASEDLAGVLGAHRRFIDGYLHGLPGDAYSGARAAP